MADSVAIKPGIDVENDQAIINLTQQKRLAFADVIATDGAQPDNPKDKRLYMELLRDISSTAQSRITSKIQANSGDKDREIVQQVVKELKTLRESKAQNVIEGDAREIIDVPIPVPSSVRFIENREVTNEIMTNEVSTETYSEFMKRTEDLDITE